MSIGERLKELRLFLGLTQEEMCQGIVSESFYSRVERGVRKISVLDLLALLNKNGIHLEDFFNEDISSISDLADISVNYDQFKSLIRKLNQEDIPENKVLEIRKLTKIAVIYLRDFYQKGLTTESRQVIELIEALPPYPLLAADKLVAQYYRRLIEKDSSKIKQVSELVKLAGCEDFLLEDLPKL